MIEIFIDDERNPADPLIKRLFGSTGSEVWVKTAKEAICLLEKGNVSSISLDHDLGDESIQNSGIAVANWIEHAAFDGRIGRLSWRIHSANPVGSKNMMRALVKADEFWNASSQQ